MRYTHTLIIYSQAYDRNGNSAHACRYIDNMTGEEERFLLDGPGNFCGHNWETTLTIHETSIPIREFTRLVKHWPYYGCTQGDILTALDAKQQTTTE